MSRRNLYWLLGITAISLLAISVSYSFPTIEENRKKSDDYDMVSLFVNILQEVEQKYVVDLTPERKRQLVEDMVNGGLERLDPHSSYINQREYKQFNKQSKGKFGGIGIQVGYDRQNRGHLVVISPMVGTPAYEAGILAGDTIVKIDGKSTENMRISEAVDLIQGDPGQKVVLSVIHEGAKEPVDIPIVRDEIHVQSVLGDLRKKDNPKEWEFIFDKTSQIAYIRLSSFSETATAEMRSAMEALQKAGARGLILDLRNNPGGLLRAAVEISNMFIKEGRIVSTKGRNHKDEIYDAKPDLALPLASQKFPIAVLVNKYSASASEILAAALQDHNRAVVIGERSYGKGSVQNIIMMEKDSSALKLTTASYWRPSGKNIHRLTDSKETDDWGVKPSEGFEVPMKDEERLEYMIWRNDRDVVRANKKAKAVEPDKQEEKAPAKEGAKPKEPKAPFVDRVFQKALDYLKKELAQGPGQDFLEIKDA